MPPLRITTHAADDAPTARGESVAPLRRASALACLALGPLLGCGDSAPESESASLPPASSPASGSSASSGSRHASESSAASPTAAAASPSDDAHTSASLEAPPTDSTAMNASSPEAAPLDPATRDSTAEDPVSLDPWHSIRERTSVGFATADFVKPRMSEDAPFDPYLAPILLREVASEAEGTSATPESSSAQDATETGTTNGENARPEAPESTRPGVLRFGALAPDASGAPRVDESKPTVYFVDEEVELAGATRRRLRLHWFVELAPGAPPVRRGLRMHFDARGFPALVEVEHDDSGARVFFASESLEEAAAAEHGAPLEGRAHALEPSLESAPEVVVARVYREGPMASGPMTYQALGSTDLVTLHCRCSPSQFSAVGEMVEYELVPLEEVSELGGDAPWRLFGAPAGASERALDELLRWPTL